MQVILCRHGRTDFNDQERFQGSKHDTSLNEKGLEHARLMAEALKEENFEYAFTSPLKRCRMTAEKIMEYHSCPLVVREELRELDYGDFSGLTPAEIKKKYPGEWEKRLHDKYNYKIINGESNKEIDEKHIAPLIEEFGEKYYSRKILVVTHGAAGRLFLGNLLGLEPDEKVKIDIPNDCIYYVNFRPNKTEIRYKRLESGEEKNGWLEKDYEKSL